MKAETLFKALADETRLRLIHLVLHHELNVNEIVAIMEMGQSRISRHLKILSDSGLLKHRKDGLWTFYSAAHSGEGRRFLNAIRFLFENDGVFSGDLVRAAAVREERSRETQRFFDAIAENWEKMKRDIIGDFDLNALILEELPESVTSVDLGCGAGDLLELLMKKSRRVIGVEKSPRMLEAARGRFSRSADHDAPDLRIGELEHLPLHPGEADLAVVNMVLHHLSEPLLAIREIHRILKRGDTLLIIDLARHNLENLRQRFGDRWLGFEPTDLTLQLKECGFKVKKIRHFDLKNDLKGFMISSVKK